MKIRIKYIFSFQKGSRRSRNRNRNRRWCRGKWSLKERKGRRRGKGRSGKEWRWGKGRLGRKWMGLVALKGRRRRNWLERRGRGRGRRRKQKARHDIWQRKRERGCLWGRRRTWRGCRGKRKDDIWPIVVVALLGWRRARIGEEQAGEEVEGEGGWRLLTSAGGWRPVQCLKALCSNVSQVTKKGSVVRSNFYRFPVDQKRCMRRITQK
jgi:hypothetical protein